MSPITDPTPIYPATVPEVPYEDVDQRPGGNDSNTMLEQLHEAAEKLGVTKGRTGYEVSFQEYDEPEGGRLAWVPVGVFQATSARDAIRQAFAADSSFAPGDVLRAIPERNITALTLNVETTTRLRLS